MQPPRNDNEPLPEPDALVTHILLWLIVGPLALCALSVAGILWHVGRAAP